jgi:hypothetical protein
MRSIKRFAPHKTAATFACVMAISSLLFILPMCLVFLSVPMTDTNGNPVSAGLPVGLLIVMPFIYLILGYVMTIIGAWIYNWVSGYTGGIQFELSTDDES